MLTMDASTRSGTLLLLATLLVLVGLWSFDTSVLPRCSAFNLNAAVRNRIAPVGRAELSMKLFDWKQRSRIIVDRVDNLEPRMNNLFPMPGSVKRRQIVGRGISAGQGATCGRGSKGQNARSGNGRGVRIGFEGGQTPLYRRLKKFPKRKMRGHTKTEYKLIKLSTLNQMPSNATVDYYTLFDLKLVTKCNSDEKLFKVVGGAEPLETRNLTVFAHAFTNSSRAAIEELGGRCILLSPTRHIPLDIALKEKADKEAMQKEKRRKLKELYRLAILRKEKRKARQSREYVWLQPEPPAESLQSKT